MAYETEYGNLITVGNAISTDMTPAFVNGSQGLALVHTQVFAENSNVIKFTKAGYLVGETVAESTDYSYSASSELTDTSVTCTAAKKVVGAKVTVEAARFAAASTNPGRMTFELGSAMARLFDYDLKALFTSLATTVTATSTLTKDNIADARYSVVSGIKGAFSGKLVGMFDYKGVNEIIKELSSISATAFGNMELLGVLGMPKPASGYAGNVLGVDIYQTDGLGTTGGDDIAAVWDPAHCFAAGVDGAGFYNSLKSPSAINGLSTEFLTWAFWKVVERNDLAGVRVLSDS